MLSRNEFDKCNACVFRDTPDWCRGILHHNLDDDSPCYDFDKFEPDKHRIVELAKKHRMTICDLIALINL